MQCFHASHNRGRTQVQWADVIICKTRMLSIFEHGMSNMVLNVGLLVRTPCHPATLHTIEHWIIRTRCIIL